jgi:precorrin-2 dehydrogenase/sirohydrochlorin ferrochelatase
MDAFPAFFPLSGRVVVIVGEGEAARAKARLFDGSPATIRRLSAEQGLSREAYVGAALVFIADGAPDYLDRAAAAARAAGVPVNVVDHPALCDFTTPSVIDRGEVVAAIGTGGASPMLATLLRQDIEARVPQGAGRVAALFRLSQEAVRAALPDPARRRAFLRAALSGEAARAAMDGDMSRAQALLSQALAAFAAGAAPSGRVRYLAAGGPADLVSLRAVAALAQADVLAIDPACDPAVLDLARRDAARVPAEGPMAETLIRLAAEGAQILRLVVGDATFEQAALTRAGVAWETLPVAQG